MTPVVGTQRRTIGNDKWATGRGLAVPVGGEADYERIGWGGLRAAVGSPGALDGCPHRAPPRRGRPPPLLNSGDCRRKDNGVLEIARQRADEIDAGDRHQFLDYVHADRSVAERRAAVTGAKDAAAAKALINFLRTPEAAAVIKAKGRRLGSYWGSPTTPQAGLSPARDTAPFHGALNNSRLMTKQERLLHRTSKPQR